MTDCINTHTHTHTHISGPNPLFHAWIPLQNTSWTDPNADLWLTNHFPFFSISTHTSVCLCFCVCIYNARVLRVVFTNPHLAAIRYSRYQCGLCLFLWTCELCRVCLSWSPHISTASGEWNQLREFANCRWINAHYPSWPSTSHHHCFMCRWAKENRYAYVQTCFASDPYRHMSTHRCIALLAHHMYSINAIIQTWVHTPTHYKDTFDIQ